MPAKRLYRAGHETASQRHICIVTETYPPEINGVAQTLARLVEGLCLQGHRVSVVRPRRGTLDATHCSEYATTLLVTGLPLPGYKGLSVGLPAGHVLGRYWTQQRPDVVYVATEGPLGWSAVRASRRLGIPVYSGFHTNFHSYSEHYHIGWLHFWILRYLCKFHNRTLGTLVAGIDLRNRLQAMGLKNLSVLGRGVDSELFSPARRSPALRRMWRASENDLVVLYVGRVASEKNLGLAIESYRAMQRVNPAVKFVIVGDGPLREALQKEHADLIFCGVHQGEELAKHYASADVFLFPSETETFGNVTLEAMASALVVVAYDYAAARMHITDGETGMLVPYGRSAAAFVDAAIRLAREPQALSRIRQQAREHAATLDWQRVVQRFAGILMGALDQDDATSAEVACEALAMRPQY